MLEWFTENAFFPSCMGILLAIAFIGLAFSSGEMIMMKIGLAIAALTALLITTEIIIVTDREQVENSLYDMASAMQKNDVDRVFQYLDSDELVQRAKGHLQDATCHACSITAIKEVTVQEDGKEATADFVAFAQASNKSFPSPTPIQRRIKLFFKKKADRWKIYDFETSDPRAGVSL
jgi:ketosteroid isomerase-like protein